MAGQVEQDSGAVTRWRLIDAIEQVPGGAVVLLVAAAGYGKTTLLRQWSGRTSRAAVVVAAAADHDAERLCLAIAEALARVLPEAGRLLERARQAEADWTCDVLPTLLDLAGRHAIALAIDDTQVLTAPSVRELLGVMAVRWPSPSILVLSGRERPPIPLVRERLAAPLVTLGERDLDFDDDELDHARVAGGIAADRDEVLARTGGWPAGVRLAALARDDTIDGSTTVEGYLSRHVLGAFHGHELDYLGQVAALAPATAQTVDAVLRRNDTLDVLAGLRRRGLPMVTVPSDPTEPIVVHALLGDVLAARLDRRAAGTTDAVVDLAVDHAERTGDPTYGFGLLVRHGRTDRIRSMPYRHMFPLVVTGRVRELRSWLERFPAADLEQDPYLVLPYANILRPRDEARVRALFAPHAEDRTTQLPDGLVPAVACRRMLTAFGLSPADPHDTDLLGGWRQTHGVTRAWDLYSADRVEEAEAELEALRDSAHKYPVTNAVRLAKLAILAIETGRPERAAGLADEAGRIVAEGGMEETALGFIVDAVLLKLARRSDQPQAAERIATAARRKLAVVGDGTMLERVTTLLEIANLYVDLDYPASMGRELRDEAAAILARWRQTARLDRQLAQLDHRLAGPGGRRPVRTLPSHLTAAELRVLRYLPSHLTLARIAAELHVSHATVKTQCQSIYRKLGVGSRDEAVTTALRLDLLG